MAARRFSVTLQVLVSITIFLVVISVATVSAFLTVGFSVKDKPTVNQRAIDRGYRGYIHLAVPSEVSTTGPKRE